MGGSLAAALKKKKLPFAIHITSRHSNSTRTIHEEFGSFNRHIDIKAALPKVDMIVLAAPVDITIKQLQEIEKNATRSVLVTDVGSTKSEICNFYSRRKWKFVRFVGSHPMVGSHLKGPQSARADLYDHGLVIVTTDGAKSVDQKAIQSFWKKMGMKVIFMKAQMHDRFVAEISHLPHLLAACLIKTPSTDALKIAASGFRDMTRLAEGNPEIWIPIFSQNKKAVLEALRSFKNNLKQFESALKAEKHQKLTSFLWQTSNLRKKLLSSTAR